MRRFKILFILLLVPMLLLAQAAGGHIKRLTPPKQKTKPSSVVQHHVQKQTSKRNIDREVPISPIIQNLINNMVYVEGGTFLMGVTLKHGGYTYNDDKPAHKVTLSSFSICKYEVTQEEWETVMGSNPSRFKGTKLPIEKVSWDDCQIFISKLNAMTGRKFRLPTEAEWEYAARGGNRGQGDDNYAGCEYPLRSVAWYDSNSNGKTHEVGLKQPNELGLYDMSGNVWEWCQDWYGSYSKGPITNPSGPSTGSTRVNRGGCWQSSDSYCSVANRSGYRPDFCSSNLGLRLVLQ